MAVMLLMMTLWLLLQGCSCSPANLGCMRWSLHGQHDACCEACHPGHRLVKRCGPAVIDLCTPCEPGTYTTSANDYQCSRCDQCEGAQVLLKNCTSEANTKCGCNEGLTCGDDQCSHCVDKGLTDDGNMTIAWLSLMAGIVLTAIVTVAIAIAKTKKKKKKSLPKLIIRPPTDDPQTLIAIECSFHEAEQEQGSSSESLFSKDSSEQLIR